MENLSDSQQPHVAHGGKPLPDGARSFSRLKQGAAARAPAREFL